MPLTPPSPPKTPPQNGSATRVWFVQGKKANREFKTALQLKRENATLSDNKENVPPEDHQQKDPQPDVNKKA